MASLLGKMTLTNCSKEKIAKRSAKVLGEMLHIPETRTASLHALCNLSSLDDNATILVEASVLPAVTYIFLESQDALPEQKELSAAIIANIVSNPGHWELAEINKEGHSMLSSFFVSHLMLLISQVTPQCQVSILRILCGIASSPKASGKFSPTSRVQSCELFQISAQLDSCSYLASWSSADLASLLVFVKQIEFPHFSKLQYLVVWNSQGYFQVLCTIFCTLYYKLSLIPWTCFTCYHVCTSIDTHTLTF